MFGLDATVSSAPGCPSASILGLKGLLVYLQPV